MAYRRTQINVDNEERIVMEQTELSDDRRCRMTLREKMMAVIADVNASVAERSELIELIAIALLTRKNLFILGDPGQAKSYAINLFRQHISGARQFERLLSKQTDEEQLFGRIDLSSLIPGSIPQDVLKNDRRYTQMVSELENILSGLPASPPDGTALTQVKQLSDNLEAYQKAVALTRGSEPVVNTSGKIPEADICFLDEIFKCNDGVLNSLLTAFNERKYTNEGRTYPIPTISFFAASNEIPNFNDPQEKILSALYDRLELKVVTENIAGRDNRLRVLKDKQAGDAGQVHAEITLEELLEMQRDVAAIPVPDAVNELVDDILCELRKAGIVVSDRKFLGYYPVAQAKAWLSGHAQVEPIDLLALKNYLWQLPGDRETVESTLQRMCVNPMQDKINDIRAMAKEVLDELDASVAAGADGKKAFRKFRTELLRVYGLYRELNTKAQSDSERNMLQELLDDLEKDSRSAHEKNGYTYATLEELAELQ